jgi:single-strand DNA-binding protein
MEGVNKVTLLGNLGADPDLRFGQGPDTAVLKIRMATTESYFNKSRGERQERTDWHNVVLFGKRAEALAKILKKGEPLYVEGRMQTDTYEKDSVKHYRTEVVAIRVVLIAGKKAGDDGADYEEEEDDGAASAPPPRQQSGQRGFGGRR